MCYGDFSLRALFLGLRTLASWRLFGTAGVKRAVSKVLLGERTEC